MSGQLVLLPVPLTDGTAAAALPAATLDAARGIDYFLAENAKSARAFLKEIGHPKPIATLRIVEIGHHPDPKAIAGWLAPIVAGATCAIVSEAGCPGVADPGAEIVAQAHRLGIVVRPLVGPSAAGPGRALRPTARAGTPRAHRRNAVVDRDALP
jgi:16S rRNA (cytidine1402-2'-O)-methyltransferase